MSIQNTQVIIIRDDTHRQSVVEFMLENNINFRTGFDGAWEASELAEELGYEESQEWMNSSC